MTSSYKTVILLLSIATIPVILLTLSISISAYYKLVRLKDHGVSTLGTVTALHAPVNPNGKDAAWTVDYTYQAVLSDGTSRFLTGQDSVIPQDFGKMTTGKQVPVIYDPNNSGNVEINVDDRVHRRKAWPILVIIMLPLLAICSLLFVRNFVKYSRQHLLLRNGHATPATILSQTEISSGRRRSTVVTYQFSDSQGNIVQGRQKGLPTKAEMEAHEDFRKYYERIMTNPTAVYDPQKPGRNMLYPSGLAALADDQEYAVT